MHFFEAFNIDFYSLELKKEVQGGGDLNHFNMKSSFRRKIENTKL